MDINYELYKVFYHVATTLSFSEAANKLFISQSAVSQSIKALEKKLNQKLFIRSTKKVRLTPEGELLLQVHLPATGTCKAGRSVLRAPKPEGAKAAVLHPVFRFRPCLKRAIQPCRRIGTLRVSAAPHGGDFAGHGSLAYGAEGKG